MTLSSLLQVPDGVTVLMSASRSSYSKLDRVFQFSMEFPVPSYLVALVAGDLQHVDVGPRSVLVLDPGCGSWSDSLFWTLVWLLV